MQRRARYARLPEFGGDHDVTQEPLEESAFQDTRFTLEALEITGWESLLPPAAS